MLACALELINPPFSNTKQSPQTSPLDVSPANHDVSKTQTKNEGATGNPSGGQVTKDRGSQTSGGSGAPKSGSGKYGSGSAN